MSEFIQPGLETVYIKPRREGVPERTRVQFFAHLGSGEVYGDTGRRIVEHMSSLSSKETTREVVQSSVDAITREVLKGSSGLQSSQNVLLVPVLRSGLAMLNAASEFFEHPEVSFLMGQKDKGTGGASIYWPKKNEMTGKKIIVLDPIIATGDTLLEVSREIENPIIVIACYVAPQGVQTLIDNSRNVDIVVGCMAESVGADGFLIPPTNGDMGDKLFGSIIDK